MKKIILAVLLLTVLSLAAPAPPAVGINPVTNECGDYFAGDEFGGDTLPEGWIPYFYATSDNPITKLGNCNFEKTELNEKSHEQICCEDLGLTYVGRVGYDEFTVKDAIEMLAFVIPPLLFILIIPAGIILAVYIKLEKKRLSNYFNKKAFIIGALIGAVLFWLGTNIVSLFTFGASIEVIAVSFVINMIAYGSLASAMSVLLKKLNRK